MIPEKSQLQLENGHDKSKNGGDKTAVRHLMTKLQSAAGADKHHYAAEWSLSSTVNVVDRSDHDDD